MSNQPPPAGPVVIDNGSGMCKAGISGEDAPRAVFPAVIGVPKYAQAVHGSNNSEKYVGEEAIAKKGVLKLSYPVEHGIVKDWDNMTLIWNHCMMNELRVTPSDFPALLTEAPRNPKANREKMCEIFFDKFNVPGFYLAIQAVLSLYSSGKITGLVLDSGDGVTHTVPIYDGYSISHAIERNDLAGRDLTNYLATILSEVNFSSQTSAEVEIAKEIKEKLCYIAMDPNQEKINFDNGVNKPVPFEMPDKSTITLKDQLFRCPEALFQPSLIGKQIPGIDELVVKSVTKCDIDVRRSLYENIVLSGGTTMFKNISERLHDEIVKRIPAGSTVKIQAATERKFLVWIGGSILSSLSTFQPMWITKQEYNETGPSIIHSKSI